MESLRNTGAVDITNPKGKLTKIDVRPTGGLVSIRVKKKPKRRYPHTHQKPLTPRQEMFLEIYYNPTSPTFANVFQSAIKSGYSEYYARTMRAPSIGNTWIKQNNRQQMTNDHIVTGIARIAHSGLRDSDKLRAYELLAKFEGMLVDKSIVGHVNIEEALKELK
jgi:hypothetical protein